LAAQTARFFGRTTTVRPQKRRAQWKALERFAQIQANHGQRHGELRADWFAAAAKEVEMNHLLFCLNTFSRSHNCPKAMPKAKYDSSLDVFSSGLSPRIMSTQKVTNIHQVPHINTQKRIILPNRRARSFAPRSSNDSIPENLNKHPFFSSLVLSYGGRIADQAAALILLGTILFSFCWAG